MDDGLRNGEYNGKVSYKKIFDDHFPFYLSIGMTYYEYYEQDPSLVIAFRKAHILKLKEKDYIAYLNGYYFYESILKLSPIFSFNGGTVSPYRDNPLLTEAFTNDKKRIMDDSKGDAEAISVMFSYMNVVNSIRSRNE